MMKISEAAKQLNDIEKQYGDLDFCIMSDTDSTPEFPIFENAYFEVLASDRSGAGWTLSSDRGSEEKIVNVI